MITQGSYYPLTPDEIEQVQSWQEQRELEPDQVTWTTGPEGRFVAQLAPSDYLIRPAPIFPDQGTFGLSVRPGAPDQAGVLLSSLDTATGAISPLLAYEAGQLRLSVGGVNVSTPFRWTPDRQHHWALAGWPASGWLSSSMASPWPRPPTSRSLTFR